MKNSIKLNVKMVTVNKTKPLGNFQICTDTKRTWYRIIFKKISDKTGLFRKSQRSETLIIFLIIYS